MHNDDFPHDEIPDGIIKVGLQKQTRLKGVVRRYAEIGFKNFSLIDLAQLSLAEWRDKKYPIPQGYKASWGDYMRKNDLKSNPFVK